SVRGVSDAQTRLYRSADIGVTTMPSGLRWKLCSGSGGGQCAFDGVDRLRANPAVGVEVVRLLESLHGCRRERAVGSVGDQRWLGAKLVHRLLDPECS